MMRKIPTLILILALCQVLVIPSVRADAESQSSSAEEAWGLATMIANVAYFPTKLAFAGLGLFTSGLTYVLSLGDQAATKHEWARTSGGTYWLIPAHLKGEEPIRFVGP